MIDALFKDLNFYENFPNDYINKIVSKETLSDGQMQKIAFIRLILQNPEIIFLKEYDLISRSSSPGNNCSFLK